MEWKLRQCRLLVDGAVDDGDNARTDDDDDGNPSWYRTNAYKLININQNNNKIKVNKSKMAKTIRMADENERRKE